MASSMELIGYICEQLDGLGVVRSRKMFGDYMIYLNDRPIITVCDDTVFAKKLPCVAELLAGCPSAAPYEGAKEHFVLDPDDRETLRRAAELLEQAVPIPKPRKKPNKTAK